jgi:hypothetical protein
MAAVTVFVDDVVTGRLPAVCVRSGVPADTWVRDRAEVGGPPLWLFLLVFLGPPGWLALVLALLLGFGRERLVVQLPFTEAELDRLKGARAQRAYSVGLAVVLALVAVTRAGSLTGTVGVAALVLVIGAVLLATLAHLRVTAMEVGVALDASRRWVTLRGVSDGFAAQVRVDQRRRDEHRHRP